MDVREHDVPYHMRFQIDTDVRCGHWFTVAAKVGWHNLIAFFFSSAEQLWHASQKTLIACMMRA